MKRVKDLIGKNARISKRAACVTVSAALVLSCLGLAGCSGGAQSGDAGAEVGSESESVNSNALIADVANMDREYTQRDKDPSYDEAASTRIALNGTTVTVDGNGATAEGSTVTINSEGSYILSGLLSDGQLIVDAADTAKIQLVLNGVEVHNEDGPAIYIKQADKCFITLADGSTNKLSDGTTYTLEDNSDEPYATLFSKDDLTINGSGALTVDAAYQHGIASKDDLVITGGTIAVSAAEDALRGRDCVKIAEGTFTIEAGEDAIKSNNDEDNTRGFVSIDGGTFAIKAGDDAIHGEFALFMEDGQVSVSSCYEGLEAQQVYVNGGVVNIVSSDDSINASSPGESTTTTGGGMVGESNGSGYQGRMQQNGTTPPGMSGEAPQGGVPQGGVPQGEVPQGGVPQGGVPQGEVPQGEAPADNGMGMTPPDMSSEVPQGEAPADNGMGNAPQNMAGGGMADEYEEGCLIEINGGEIDLVTEGDGIDSNGDFTMNGGTLSVSGPTNSGNGSLDVAGSAIVNGGTALMAGSSGMAQSFAGGNQAFLMAQISGTSGETIKITNASGNEIAAFTPKAQYSVVIASSPQMKSGETYTITAGASIANAQAQ